MSLLLLAESSGHHPTIWGKAFWESSQIRQALGTDANPPADARVITPSIQKVPGWAMLGGGFPTWDFQKQLHPDGLYIARKKILTHVYNLGGGNSNIFFIFHPEKLGKMNPFWGSTKLCGVTMERSWASFMNVVHSLWDIDITRLTCCHFGRT